MTVRSVFASVLIATFATGIAPSDGVAQPAESCFVGQDQFGAPVRMLLQVERYGDYFEVFGRLQSQNIGTMQLKADGWSGAGRMFRNHEYEGGAVFIEISNYTGSSLVLNVDGYGSFQFRAAPC